MQINSQNTEIYLILDNIRSLLNIGAIFRTADAVGVKKIYLCGISGYPTNKLIKKIDGIDVEPIVGDDEGNAIIKYKPSYKCTEEFLYKNIAKTALSGLDTVEWKYSISTIDIITKLKKENTRVVALEQARDSVNYCDANYSKPLAIIVGNEMHGIKKNVLDLCDQIVEIPMNGVGKSLNVATATGIILYKAVEKD
jgi:23S rRNA (guanosine2251-2'-O)-methyltransferase